MIVIKMAEYSVDGKTEDDGLIEGEKNEASRIKEGGDSLHSFRIEPNGKFS